MKNKSLALWLTALGPFAILITCLSYGAWQEYRTWQIVRQEMVEVLQQANTTMRLRQARYTNPAGDDKAALLAFEEITLMASSLGWLAEQWQLSIGRDAYSPAISVDPELWSPILGAEPHSSAGVVGPKSWPEAPLAKILTDTSEPMILKLETWLASKSDLKHLLPYTTELDGLLANGFRSSFHSDDSEQAMRYLKLMGKLVLTEPIEMSYREQAECLHRRYEFYRLVGLSLQRSDWKASELEELSNLVSLPLNMAERLQAVRQSSGEALVQPFRGDFDGNVNDEDEDIHWPANLDSAYLKGAFEALREPVGLADINDFGKISERLNQSNQLPRAGVFAINHTSYMNSSWIASALNQIPCTAMALGVVEDKRRWLLVGVAIRQFQIENERLPESLQEVATKPENQDLILTSVCGDPTEYHLHKSFPTPGDLTGYALLIQGFGFLDVNQLSSEFQWLRDLDRGEPMFLNNP